MKLNKLINNLAVIFPIKIPLPIHFAGIARIQMPQYCRG